MLTPLLERVTVRVVGEVERLLLALAVTALAVGHTPVIGRVLSVLWRMVGV